MGTSIAQIPNDPGHRKGQPGKRSTQGRLPTLVCAEGSKDHKGDQTTDYDEHDERDDDHDNSVLSSGTRAGDSHESSRDPLRRRCVLSPPVGGTQTPAHAELRTFAWLARAELTGVS